MSHAVWPKTSVVLIRYSGRRLYPPNQSHTYVVSVIYSLCYIYNRLAGIIIDVYNRKSSRRGESHKEDKENIYPPWSHRPYHIDSLPLPVPPYHSSARRIKKNLSTPLVCDNTVADTIAPEFFKNKI